MRKRCQASAAVTFHDVAAYFSEEEWRLLHEWQKELYMKVMMEIHSALLSLGFQIANPETLFRVAKRETLNTQDDENTLESSDSLTDVKPDILLRIKPDEEVRSSVQQHSSESEIKGCPDTGEVVIKSVVSFIIKEEGGGSSVDEEITKNGENTSSPSGVTFPNPEKLLRIKEESETTLLDDHVRKVSGGSPGPSSGCGIKGRKNKSGYSAKVFNTTLKALSPGIITEVPKCFENGGHTAIQWPASNCQPGEKSLHFESSFGLPVPSNVNTQDIDIPQSETYKELSSHQRNVTFHPCSLNVLSSWRPSIFKNDDTGILVSQVQTGEIPPHNAKCNKVVPQTSTNGEKTVHKPNRKEKPNLAERSFICDVCQKTFRRKDTLTKHQRIHTGEKPYQCSNCERRFNRKESLIIHIRTHTGERPFACTECDFTFINKGNLITHWRTHTGDKPYRCSECKKQFTVKIGLMRHKRTHTGEKPYKCTECEKSFTQKQNLIKHQRTHSGENPYQCCACEKYFSDEISFYTHQRSHIRERKTL